MKCSTICAAFFAAVVAATSDVVQLKTDDFKEFVQDNDLVLAECKCELLRPPIVTSQVHH
jgi:protein disulfide-isomerase A1